MHIWAVLLYHPRTLERWCFSPSSFCAAVFPPRSFGWCWWSTFLLVGGAAVLLLLWVVFFPLPWAGAALTLPPWWWCCFLLFLVDSWCLPFPSLDGGVFLEKHRKERTSIVHGREIEGCVFGIK